MADDLDVVAFARTLFPQFARVTVLLAVERTSQILGTVGGGLTIAAHNLDKYSNKQDPTFQAQLERILVLLTRLCTVGKKTYLYAI